MDDQHNRVGLGTFPFASVFAPITKREAQFLVAQFLDNGGYYIDTAPLYGFGQVEILLRDVLRDYPRDAYHIVSKCGYVDVLDKTFETVTKSGKYDAVILECDRSLQRMHLDYIDTYLLHITDPTTPIAETLGALEKLKADGKVRAIGVCNVTLPELMDFNQNKSIAYVQNRFSLINRSIDASFASYLTDNHIQLIPYQVIERSQLSSKGAEAFASMRTDDLRSSKPDWQSEPRELIASWVHDELAPIAKSLGITVGQLSIAWALHQPYVGFAIVGNTTPGYTVINLKANIVSLSPEILAQIATAYTTLEAKVKERSGKSIREFRGLNERYC